MLKRVINRLIIYMNAAVAGLILTVLFLHSQAQSVRINEFMALNSTTIMDEDGEYSDSNKSNTESACFIYGKSLTRKLDLIIFQNYTWN